MASQEEIYQELWVHRVPQDRLERLGYPSRDPENHDLRLAPCVGLGPRIPLEQQFASDYKCKRCSQMYRVGEDGVAQESNTCRYHSYTFDRRYSIWNCCKKRSSGSEGCVVATHAHNGENLMENFRGFVATEAKDDLEPNKHGVFALDCEMVDTAYGLELAQVSVLNYRGQVVYDELVRPTNRVINYNTVYSGLDAATLDNVTTRLADVQDQLRSMFSSKTLLVGHGLDSDMKALKLFHTNFLDTVHLYPHPKGLPFRRALRILKAEYLNIPYNYAAAHDSGMDARNALQLVYRKANIRLPLDD